MMLSAKKKKMKVVVQTCYDDVMPAFYNTSQIAAESGTLIEHLSTEVPLWCPANPVLLDLPTGSGKTTFVYQTLLTEAMARRKNLLLVSNRIALSSQQKLAIMDVLDDPRKKLLTEEGVRLTEDFGCVRVITYHRLPALLRDQSAKDWIANLCYVVLDECHFFTADAVFNERADYYLRLVCEKFCHAVRVYLTATSWDVLVPLAQAELKYYRPRVPMCVHPFVRECHRYTMPVSYDSYALHFFDVLDELVDKIAGNISEKWMIFVDNKERGKHLLDACKKKSISCTYLDAESKGSTSWKHIVKNEQFEEQVLITTAVLDNGININDDAVKNVAIMTDNRVSFVQMLGRKRLKRGERVHVWVRNLPMKTIAARYQQYAAWHDWYRYVEQCAKREHDYLAKKLWNHEDATLRKLFHLHDGVIYPNELAKYVIVRREMFYGKILRGETDFRKEVQSWFGIDAYKKSAETKLHCFYLEYGGQALNEALQEKLRDILHECYAEYGGKSWKDAREKTVGNRALNHYMHEMRLSYVITRVGNLWFLEKEGVELLETDDE